MDKDKDKENDQASDPRISYLVRTDEIANFIYHLRLHGLKMMRYSVFSHVCVDVTYFVFLFPSAVLFLIFIFL